MFPFFETMAIRQHEILNQKFHQLRMNRTFERFYSDTTPLQLNEISLSSLPFHDKIIKVKLFYNQSSYQIHWEDYSVRVYSSFTICRFEKLNYNFKYSDRIYFQNLRNSIPLSVGILLTDGQYLTDELYSNICLFDGSEWLSPNPCLLDGTQKESLIHQDILKSRTIPLKDMIYFNKFKLINALNSFHTALEYPMNLIISDL